MVNKLNVVLVEPEIPQNTGNIARTCAVVGAALHLVEPLGFEISAANVRRAGLDYWDKLELYTYSGLPEFFEKTEGVYFFFSTKAKKLYTQVKYPQNTFLVFGKETKGLPEALVYGNPDSAVKIPMGKDLRSLNLSNATAIAVYEALRQVDFYGLE